MAYDGLPGVTGASEVSHHAAMRATFAPT